jgi:CysZ protein
MVWVMTHPSPVPAFAPRPSGADFFQGLALLGRALQLIVRSPRLRALGALCAAVTLVTLVGLVVAVWKVAPLLLGSVWARPEAWYAQALWYGVLVLSSLILLVVGASTVVPVVLAPLQDPLSEHTEELCGGYTSAPFHLGAFLRSVLTSVAHTLARVALLLVGLAVLLPLHLLPGVGSALWTVLASLWSMLWLAGEHLAAPMTRHLYPFASIRRAVRSRWALCLGFGAGTYVLLWVPVLNGCFLPVAVVGGTLLYRGLRQTGDVPPPPAAGK